MLYFKITFQCWTLWYQYPLESVFKLMHDLYQNTSQLKQTHFSVHSIRFQLVMWLDLITLHIDYIVYFKHTNALPFMWQHVLTEYVPQSTDGQLSIQCAVLFSMLFFILNNCSEWQDQILLKYIINHCCAEYHWDAEKDKPTKINSHSTFIVLGSIMKFLSF